MLRRLLVLFLGSAPLALSAACAASLDLDRFTKAEAPLVPDGGGTDAPGPGTVTYLDLAFSAKSMNSHFNEVMELRIVDKDNNVQAKLVSENIQYPGGVVAGSLDFAFFMKGIIPKTNGPYRIDFWADHNLTGKYEGIVGGIDEKDHAWRRILSDELPEDIVLVGTTYRFDFVHDTNFVDIYTDLQGNKISGEDTLLDFNLKVAGAGAYLGKTLEMRVVDKATGRLVGVHRRGTVPETYDVKIAGIIDEVTPYEIRAYVDSNGDQKWVEGEPSWKIEITSATGGVTGTLDLAATAQTPLDPADTP